MTPVKKIKAIPSNLVLPDTLAGRVFELRHYRNLTVRDLARASRLTPEKIEDIESGIETWLSSPVRQRIAGALNVEPIILKEVELRPESMTGSKNKASSFESLHDRILQGETSLSCPDCGKALKTWVKDGFDLNERPIAFASAHCSSCPFVL